MKKYLFFSILTGIMVGTASAQYVAGALANRIKNDQEAIALDQADITVKNADIQSVLNDTQINSIVNEIQPVQANAVVVNGV